MGEKEKAAAGRSNGFSVRGKLVVLYICLTAYIGLAVTNSFLNFSTEIFAGQFGWNSVTLLSQNSIFCWLTIILLVVIGQFLMKYSPRIMALIVGGIYTLTCFLVPYISTMWQYTVALGILNIFNTLWMIQINAVIITNWFPKKQGTVMGLMSFAMSLGTGTGVGLFSVLLTPIGHTGVWAVFGAVNVVCLLLLAFFVKDTPRECGEFPDNAKTASDSMPGPGGPGPAGMGAHHSVWTVKNLLSTPQTWMVGLALGTLPLFTSAYTSQMFPHFLSLGLDQAGAARLVSMMSVFGCIGSLICGALVQKIGARKGFLVCSACVVVAAALNAIPSVTTATIALAFVGMCLGGSSVFLVSTISEYWGHREFISAQRAVMPIQQTIGAAGTIVMAVCSSAVSYEFAFTVLCAAAAVGFVLVLIAKPNSVMKRQKELEAVGADR